MRVQILTAWQPLDGSGGNNSPTMTPVAKSRGVTLCTILYYLAKLLSAPSPGPKRPSSDGVLHCIQWTVASKNLLQTSNVNGLQMLDHAPCTFRVRVNSSTSTRHPPSCMLSLAWHPFRQHPWWDGASQRPAIGVCGYQDYWLWHRVHTRCSGVHALRSLTCIRLPAVLRRVGCSDGVARCRPSLRHQQGGSVWIKGILSTGAWERNIVCLEQDARRDKPTSSRVERGQPGMLLDGILRRSPKRCLFLILSEFREEIAAAAYRCIDCPCSLLWLAPSFLHQQEHHSPRYRARNVDIHFNRRHLANWETPLNTRFSSLLLILPRRGFFSTPAYKMTMEGYKAGKGLLVQSCLAEGRALYGKEMIKMVRNQDLFEKYGEHHTLQSVTCMSGTS